MGVIIDIPEVLSVMTPDLRLMNRTTSSNVSLSGLEQIGESISQRWAFTMEFNNLPTSAVRPYRAFVASLKGRVNAARIPIKDPVFGPKIDFELSRFSDTATLSGGALFKNNDLLGVSVSGSKGENSLDIPFGQYGEILQAGMYFGLGDDLYICTEISYKSDASTAVISFEPSLRRDYADEAVLLRPFLIGRLTSDDVGNHPLKFGFITSPTLDFVEALRV